VARAFAAGGPRWRIGKVSGEGAGGKAQREAWRQAAQEIIGSIVVFYKFISLVIKLLSEI
jgi:hypothetical protein